MVALAGYLLLQLLVELLECSAIGCSARGIRGSLQLSLRTTDMQAVTL
jgi:hypothetical protein